MLPLKTSHSSPFSKVMIHIEFLRKNLNENAQKIKKNIKSKMQTMLSKLSRMKGEYIAPMRWRSVQ